MADAYGHDLFCPAAGKLDRSPQLPGKLAAILRNRIRRGTDPQQKRDLLDDPQHGVFPRVIR